MTRILLLTGLGFAVLMALIVGLSASPRVAPRTLDLTAPPQPAAGQVSTPAAPEIFASPIHGGCYIAGPSDCRLHVEPFTINIAAGKKLSFFQLVAIQMNTGAHTVMYDWRPDQSNGVPVVGTTYTPSLVAQDFAATCGKSYEISLQGKDTGDTSAFNLGLTGRFTCTLGLP
jgi:hypothetical protein